MLKNIILDNIIKDEDRIIKTNLISTASDLLDYDSNINSADFVSININCNIFYRIYIYI